MIDSDSSVRMSADVLVLLNLLLILGCCFFCSFCSSFLEVNEHYIFMCSLVSVFHDTSLSMTHSLLLSADECLNSVHWMPHIVLCRHRSVPHQQADQSGGKPGNRLHPRWSWSPGVQKGVCQITTLMACITITPGPVFFNSIIMKSCCEGKG